MTESTRRSTRQRQLIAEALTVVDRFCSAQVLHEAIVKNGGKVGLTTVYRALQNMSDQGQVDVIRTSSGEALYRMCERAEHHHHLVCGGCGLSVEIEGAEIESWVDRTARNHGFVPTGHTAEVYGLCPSCAD